MRTGPITAALLCLAAAGAHAEGGAGAHAGADCYNDESTIYHRDALPDELRVTEADMSALLLAIARHEAPALAEREAEIEAAASNSATRDGG